LASCDGKPGAIDRAAELPDDLGDAISSEAGPELLGDAELCLDDRVLDDEAQRVSLEQRSRRLPKRLGPAVEGCLEEVLRQPCAALSPLEHENAIDVDPTKPDEKTPCGARQNAFSRPLSREAHRPNSLH
jgi:hypothetical protein